MTQQNQLEAWLLNMWQDYCLMNPQSAAIEKLLKNEGETIVNDHIALRTFNHPSMDISVFANLIKDFGYSEKQHYEFKEKKLHAVHYEHQDDQKPKIFVSELLVEKCSSLIQETVLNLAPYVKKEHKQNLNFMMMGRPWPMSYSLYENLAKESEYASWLAAHGFRPNHFTVAIHFLKKLSNIRTLNQFLLEKGYTLNSSGGLIKGNQQEFLEQSSTMAGDVPVSFTEGVFKIPGCYYEFAMRYAMPNGKLFHGFVAASADKIFESTNRN